MSHLFKESAEEAPFEVHARTSTASKGASSVSRPTLVCAGDRARAGAGTFKWPRARSLAYCRRQMTSCRKVATLSRSMYRAGRRKSGPPRALIPAARVKISRTGPRRPRLRPSPSAPIIAQVRLIA